MTNAIEFTGVTKSFGDVLAVDDVRAVAAPGEVTALLGPNGAGKTTTLRMLLGLVAPSSGAATFGGMRYDELPDPVRQVGAVLEASGCHPGRTAIDHLEVTRRLADEGDLMFQALRGQADDLDRAAQHAAELPESFWRGPTTDSGPPPRTCQRSDD